MENRRSSQFEKKFHPGPRHNKKRKLLQGILCMNITTFTNRIIKSMALSFGNNAD